MSNKTTQEATAPNFNEMPLGKLKEYASHLRVAITKDATKEEIIEAISKKQKGRTVASLATDSSRPKPGYSRIRIDETQMSDKQLPVYVNDNGLEYAIPRAVAVDVPSRIVDHLRRSVVKRRRQVEGEPGKPPVTTMIDVPQYPFQVLESTPGPMVKSKREIAAEKNIGPRLRYRELFGRWPRPRDITRAIESGLIQLQGKEELPDSEYKAAEKAKD